MARQSNCRLDLHRPNLVGTVHTPGGITAARRMAKRLDAVEIRADCLKTLPSATRIADLKIPAIVTVRRRDEGGSSRPGDSERIAIYQSLLPVAAAIDVELRSLPALASIIGEARKKNVAVILSFHDFASTPPLAELRRIIQRARSAGADVVKIAALTNRPAEAARLVELWEEQSAGPLALMGMGTMGQALRLFFARQGSVLNYGWLDKPQVSGQWSAAQFDEILSRLPSKPGRRSRT